MGKQATNSVHYLPESPHVIHANKLAEISGSPEETAEAAPNSPTPAATSFDMSAPLARIEDAWHYIESCSERIQELEALVTGSATSASADAGSAIAAGLFGGAAGMMLGAAVARPAACREL